MKCKDCLYYYADCDDNGVPIDGDRCHYVGYDGYAPCEVDDEYETPDVDDESMEE